MTFITSRSSTAPLLRPRALANGTIGSRHLEHSREFYVDVLGLDVVEPAGGGLVVRLGNDHTYLVEQVGPDAEEMPLLNHNGLFLQRQESVDEAHRKVAEVKERYGVRVLTKPMWQHGSYAFFLRDRDANWWEFYHAPRSPREDLTGRPQMTPDESREWFQARRERDEREAADLTDGFAPSDEDGGPLIRSECMSHGTVESADIAATRRFYEEVLGLNVRQLVPVSIHFDLGDGFMYAAVGAPKASGRMPTHFRNSLLFDSDDEVNAAREVVSSVREEHGIAEIGPLTSIVDRYFFRIRDLDGNCWELANDVHGGYHGLFRTETENA